MRRPPLVQRRAARVPPPARGGHQGRAASGCTRREPIVRCPEGTASRRTEPASLFSSLLPERRVHSDLLPLETIYSTDLARGKASFLPFRRRTARTFGKRE